MCTDRVFLCPNLLTKKKGEQRNTVYFAQGNSTLAITLQKRVSLCHSVCDSIFNIEGAHFQMTHALSALAINISLEIRCNLLRTSIMSSKVNL
jgi:hypothetical protein